MHCIRPWKADSADPLVSQIINPDHLAELLRGGTVPTDFGKVSFNVGELSAASLSSMTRAWLGTHYGVGRFSIRFPANALPTEQVRLRMELLTWHWELTGIELPAKLCNQLAQKLAKKFSQPSPAPPIVCRPGTEPFRSASAGCARRAANE